MSYVCGDCGHSYGSWSLGDACECVPAVYRGPSGQLLVPNQCVICTGAVPPLRMTPTTWRRSRRNTCSAKCFDIQQVRLASARYAKLVKSKSKRRARVRAEIRRRLPEYDTIVRRLAVLRGQRLKLNAEIRSLHRDKIQVERTVNQVVN